MNILNKFNEKVCHQNAGQNHIIGTAKKFGNRTTVTFTGQFLM